MHHSTILQCLRSKPLGNYFSYKLKCLALPVVSQKLSNTPMGHIEHLNLCNKSKNNIYSGFLSHFRKKTSACTFKILRFIPYLLKLLLLLFPLLNGRPVYFVLLFFIFLLCEGIILQKQLLNLFILYKNIHYTKIIILLLYLLYLLHLLYLFR